MRSSIEALERDISEITAMARSIDPISKLLNSSENREIQAYLQVRRRFDYSAVIIALYASFERFMEDIVTAYVTILSRQDRYAALPQNLLSRHLMRTGEILSKSRIDAARYPGVTANKLVENLHLCLTGAHPYELNHVAITSHDRNMRYDELGLTLKLVEISQDDVRKAQPLLDWYYKEEGPVGDPPEIVPVTVLRERLDGLVERRNDIAHRGGNPSDRLGAEGLQRLVDFIQALASSIFTIFVAKYLGKIRVGKSGCEQFVRVRDPLQQQMVWVIAPTKSALYVGQPIFALSRNFPVRWGRVTSLRLGNRIRRRIAANSSQQIGVG
ncbi:MAE_28990/MAE_18760 family HEPN-like nuclease, partial [Methylobacterium sp. NPDC097178]